MNPNDILSIAKDWSCCFAIFIFFAVFLVTSIAQSRRKKQHDVELRMLAAQNNWQFYKNFNFPFLAELGLYSGKTEKGWLGTVIDNPLTVSSKNVIQGTLHGRSFAVFEQTYTRGAGDHSRDVSQTLFAVELKEMNLPVFCLEPDTSGDFFSPFSDERAARLDINFQTHPKFSSTYLLYGQDERRIRDLFRTPVLSFYEQQPPFMTVAGGRYLVVYQAGRVFSANEITPQIGFLFALAKAFTSGR